jgi:hypothetical protein
MNKKTKMYLGLGVVAVAAYYFYHQAQMKKAAAPVAPTKSMVGFASEQSTGQSKY